MDDMVETLDSVVFWRMYFVQGSSEPGEIHTPHSLFVVGNSWNICVTSNKTLKYMILKQKMTELKGETDNLIIINFNTSQ